MVVVVAGQSLWVSDCGPRALGERVEQGVGRAGLGEEFQTTERTEEPRSRPDRVARVSVEVLFRGQERRV